MELYIHIPFCVRKCNYCDFLSFPGYGCGADERHRSLSASYVDALCRELEGIYLSLKNSVTEEGTGKDQRIDTCFIGGGTPSVLNLEELDKLLKQAWKCINASRGATGKDYAADCKVEFTIECNPGTLDREKLLLLKKHGVNRLSIGLQSADDKTLLALGRIHKYEDFVKNYRQARELGFNNINIDLISAVPGQTLENWKNTLEKAVDLEPEHISAYSLILEEKTPLYDMYMRDPAGLHLPDEDLEREMYHVTGIYLKEHGYKRYEISNYARNGYECRHNIGYWTGEEYIGAGLGAASYMSVENARRIRNIVWLEENLKDCKAEMLRMKNTEDLELYIACSFEMEQLNDDVSKSSIYNIEEVLCKADLMAEFCILGLRMCHGISMEEFKRRFGKDIRYCFGDIIDEYLEKGLLKLDDDSISFTEKGLDLSNLVLSEFLEYDKN